jgi:hypothetical protein
VAKAPAAAAAAANRGRIRGLARRLLDATANPDGPGLLLRGEEYQPCTRSDLDPTVLEPLLRLARLANSLIEPLGECPDAQIRRSVAVLAARAHPLCVAFDD